MRIKGRIVVTALTAAAAVVALATPSQAAFLPVGAGVWGPSTAVTASSSCSGGDTGGAPCQILANSRMPGTPAIETCNNASYVIQQPVIIGTNFGCNVTFSATMTITGSGADVGTDPVEIEVGACAGFTLSDAELVVNDNATGEYVLHPRVVVTPTGWNLEGNFVGANVTTVTAYVIHAVGKVAPACQRVRLANGETVINFWGTFQGSYQIL
jgi:hypothetical protein